MNAAIIAQQFVEARLSARPLSEHPGVVPSTLEAAYLCQRKRSNSGPIIGGEITHIDVTSYIDRELVGQARGAQRDGAWGNGVHTREVCLTPPTPACRRRYFTGMSTGVHAIRIGQHSRRVFSGYGEVGCRAVRALPMQAAHHL